MTEVAGETIEFNGTKYTAVQEGRAKILTPYRDPSSQTVHKTSRNNNNNAGVQAVFYNRIQQFNRDLSVLAILVHGEGALVEKAARVDRKVGNYKRQKGRKKEKRIVRGPGQDSHLGAADNTGVDQIEETGAAVGNGLEEGEQGHASPAKRKRSDILGADDQVNGDEGELPSKKTRLEETANGDIVETTSHDLPVAADEESPLKQNGKLDPSVPSITDLTTKSHKIRYSILDALSATGLRALRYAKEIPFVTRVVANDLLPEAVKSIETNVKFNEVEDRVTANLDDARLYMYSKVGNEMHHPHDETYVHRFDVVDLDPYGTAAPFFDSALQALQDGGLLCVTCTDAAVFASNGYPEKGYSLYAGMTMKGVHSHEAGLRLILHAISLSAAKYGIAIEPLLSLSIDFYARLFIRIHKRPQDVKLLSGTSMLTYNCDSGCGAWKIQKIGRNTAKENRAGDIYFQHSYAQGPSTTPNCEHCGFKTHVAGPMWAGPLHNPFFIKAILAKLPSLDRNVYGTVDRIEGMLKTAIEEDLSTKSRDVSTETKSDTTTNPLPASALIPRIPPESEDPMPFFFIPTFLAKVLHTVTPSEAALRSAFISLGYHVTRSHCKPGSFKTNAPWNVIWEIFREWVRKGSHPGGALKEGTAGHEIMKRVRGSNTAKVKSYKDELIQRLSKTSDIDELKSVMEAAMFRLEQLQGKTKEADTATTNGHVEGDGEVEIPKPEEKLDSPDKLNIIFDEKLGKENKEKLVRYQINMPHWGPMNKATGSSS